MRKIIEEVATCIAFGAMIGRALYICVVVNSKPELFFEK